MSDAFLISMRQYFETQRKALESASAAIYGDHFDLALDIIHELIHFSRWRVWLLCQTRDRVTPALRRGYLEGQGLRLTHEEKIKMKNIKQESAKTLVKKYNAEIFYLRRRISEWANRLENTAFVLKDVIAEMRKEGY